MKINLRPWALIALAVVLLAAASCGSGRNERGPLQSPVPTKTLRPTFTSTPARAIEAFPTATPGAPEVAATDVEAPSEAPAPTEEVPTPEPPTPEPPTAEPEAARFTVSSDTLNVRSGPGTNYAIVGRIRQGQQFDITGRNPGGDWWEFDYNGRSGWVVDRLVTATGTEAVEVAANIPQAPTPRPTARPQPRPTARPQQPQQPAPQPAYQFAAAGVTPYVNTNNLLTVRCRTVRDVGAGQGPAGTIKVSGPGGERTVGFGTILNRANTGMEKTSQYMYNENCKVEIAPFVAGEYTAVLVDGGGNPISEPIRFNAGGDQREFIVIWNPR